ncbi:hypothetical protein GF366_04825, partial [Candidatus Peregrinibacteria bacterium]|nr:hypothetical protein [Candidatus Peregrinibacteria bacterium]
MGFLHKIPVEYYAFTALLNFLTCFSLAFFILLRSYKSSINRSFAAFCLCIAQWSFFYFFWLSTPDVETAGFFFRTCMVGVIFMPVTFTHFVIAFTRMKMSKVFLRTNYCISIVFVLVVYSELFAYGGSSYFTIPFWPFPGKLFPLHLLHFFLNIVFSYGVLIRVFRQSTGVFRQQNRYVIFGTIVGFIGGATNYFAWYRIALPPVFNVSASLGVPIITYAILKYRLMDIKVALTRAGIFLFVYVFVLGVPFVFGFVSGLWKWAVLLMG